MISLKELLGNTNIVEVPHAYQINLEALQKALNEVRTKWGKPMIVTSGFRSKLEHIGIYRKKGIPDSKIPMGSAHLFGLAVDISDPNQDLQKWLINNESLLQQLGLYCEHFSVTKNWVHFQLRAPKSGSRFFYP